MCKYMNILWRITKYKILLEVYRVDSQKCEGVLPPTELGKCIDWSFTLEEDGKVCNFFASWDIRKVKNFKKLSAVIEKKIGKIIVH